MFPRPGGLENPLQYDTLQEILSAVAGFLFTISIPIVTIMILIGAFQILTAAGNEERIRRGKRTITWAVVGFLVVLIAGGVTQLIENLLSDSGGGGGCYTNCIGNGNSQAVCKDRCFPN
jgi:hypothetical protein